MYSFFYKPILNINNSIFSFYDNSYYILFISSNCSFKRDYLINGRLFLSYTYKLDWKRLWARKVDYICNYYDNNKSSYIYLNDSFDYFISLAECSIFLLNSFEDYIGNASLCYLIYNYFDFQNPLNIKIDLSERNFSEFLRMLFYNNEIDYKFIDSILMYYSGIYNYNLVLIRLLFPSNYFYSLEMYFVNNDSHLLLDIISKISLFEEYVINIYNLMSKYQKIKKISF